MKFKKLEKNILICSLSVVGLGAVVGTSLAIANEIKPTINDDSLQNNNIQNGSNTVFLGTTLTKTDIQKMGWDRKKSISLADWAKQAPNVTQLGNGDALSSPFYANNLLESIEIPAKVTNINNSAFYSTPSLARVSFETNSTLTNIGDKAFNNSGIEEIHIPTSVSSIGTDAFRNTTNLTPEKIFLPESIKSQSNDPLYGFAPDQWESSQSTKATFNGNTLDKNAVRSLGWSSKSEITLEDWKNAPNVIQISEDSNIVSGENSAFQASTSLQKITIPARVRKINYSSFARSSVKEVAFEAGSQLREIGNDAFYMSQLTTITIPVGTTTISTRAFGNSRLTSISIPHSVTSISRASAFQNTHTTLSGSNIWMPTKFRTSTPAYGFSSAQWNSINWVDQHTGTTLTKADVVRLGWNFKKTITLNDWINDAPNVTVLKGDDSGADTQGNNSPFSGNSFLETIQIPDKVTEIQFASFARTSKLRAVTFGPNSKLSVIGQYAFDQSTINNIVIPSSVVRIRHFSFTNTTRLNAVTFEPNSKLKLIEWSTFQNSAIRSITIPDSEGLVMHDDIFKNTPNLQGANVSMPDVLRTTANSNRYGFTQAQWDSIKWRAGTFKGTVLTKADVLALGWEKKTTITLADWAKDAPNVTQLGNPSITTGDGSQAPFSFNSNLQSIQIPAKVQKINFASFHQTPNLRTVNVESGSQLNTIGGYVFRISGVTTMNIPNTVTSIGEAAFKQTSINNLTLPSSLTFLGKEAFSEARSLTSITIPRLVTALLDDTFRNATSLSTINFAANSSVTSIERYAFADTGITSIQIPKSVRSLGRYTFLRTKKLRSFTFENGSQLTTLGHRVFQEAGFNTLVLPSSLVNVENETFAFSGSIINITMSSKLRKGSLVPIYGLNSSQWERITWVVETFTGTVLKKYDVVNLNWWGKTSITLDDWKKAPNVTHLGVDATSGNIAESPFANNTTLAQIVLPSKLTHIGYNAFSGTTALKGVTFQDGSKLTNIGTQAFDRSSLTSIFIPDLVTTIASNAFTSTAQLLGAQISMSSNLRRGSLTGLYGLTDAQWNAINWRIQQFKGTTLSKVDVINLNWHIKTEITQADWTSLAPSVTKISNFYENSGDYENAAFFRNTNLRKIFIPAKITQINYSSFNGASNLREINFQANSQLNLIGVLAFKETGLLTMNVPDSVTEIAFGAFENARSIATINFNSKTSQLTTIGTNAFIGTRALTEMIFPEKTKTIGETIFVGASSLRKIYVPNSTTSINNGAFGSIPQVQGNQISMLITLRGGSSSPKYGFTQAQWNSIAWRTIPFDGTRLLKADVEKLGWNLKETITLDDWSKDAPRVTEISEPATSGEGPTAAFSGNTKLKSIVIPEKVTQINFGSFYQTSSLTQVTFENNSKLQLIGPASFRLSALNSINIPASVTEIGSHAFQSSTSFREITFAEGSKLIKLGDGVFDGTNISAIVVPSSVTTIGDAAFSNTSALQGQNVSMDIKLKKSSASPLYGFTKAQWDKIDWRGTLDLRDTINSSFFVDFTENSNIVTLPALTPKPSNNMSAEAKDAGLSLQFAIGSSANNLIVEWGTAAAVKTAIATYSQNNNILKSDLNIFARMYLPRGTGENNNMIGNVTYNWSKTSIKIYDSTAGIVPNLFVAPGTTTTLSNKFIRAYAKIQDTWANSLSAGGNKASAVKVTSTDSSFDVAVYAAMGVNLEVSVDSGTTWTVITTLGAQTFDASRTNKMQFRLNVSDPKFYEITGSTVATGTSPSGIRTNVVEKDVIAKKELTGILAENLITNKLAVSGTTHNLVINENPELYTASGMSLSAAKAIFEIKYSYDNGTTYFNSAAFITKLNGLRASELNGVNLANFKVRYEFTAEGLEKYYSTQVANDPEATNSATKTLPTTNVVKTIDLTSQIADVAKIQISGSTESIVWKGNEFLASLASLVKVEYGTYVRANDGTVSYQWTETMPTTLYTNTIPEGQKNYPLAIRFVSKVADAKEEIGSINSAGTFTPSNTEMGYQVDASKLVSVIRVDSTELVNKLILTGLVNNLNNGASSETIEEPAIALVDAVFRNQVKLEYQISTLISETWLSLDQLKQYLTQYISDYSNETSGILIFSNTTIAGVSIKARFVAKDPSKYTVISEPNAEVTLNTSQLVTNVDLKEYVKVLQTEKVVPSGTSAGALGTLTLPPMKSGNVPFSGKTYNQIASILSSVIDIQFKAPGFHSDGWVPLDQITAVNVDNELYIRFVVKTGATSNINLSLVTNNDWTSHQNTGFKLTLRLPIEIQVDSANLVKLITLSGNTKDLVINDDAVYEQLNTNPLYVNKVQILYTIGTSPIHLDPANPDKTEFSKNELISLLKNYTTDVTLSQKQITAKYALAPGVSEEEFIIKDKTAVNLTVANVLLYINKSNYYELASKLSVSGTSSAINWGPEIAQLTRELSKGLVLQYSTDNTAALNDPSDSTKWTTEQPTTIDPVTKFLAVRMIVLTGYVFEEEPRLFNVNTDNVLLVIALQSSTLQLVTLTGNTRDITIDLTKFDAALTESGIPGQEFIEVQYYFGGTPPASLNIAPGTEWFSAAQIKTILAALKGAKNTKELILFRNSLKARYSLNDEGYKTYRMNIDGNFIDGKFPEQPSLWKDLVTDTINSSFEGYINLDLFNTFTADNFQIFGSDKKPQLKPTNKVSEMFDFYKNQSTAPFDIYYSKTNSDFTNTTYKLFGENGFIDAFDSTFVIDLDTDGNPLPIYFKIVARAGYKIWEKDAELANGKVITITNFDIQPQITNPLKTAPDIKFVSSTGATFYQGEGSLSVYVSGTNTLVDQTFLNQEYPDVVPHVLELEYNVSDVLYSPEELAAIVEDKTQWSDQVPTNLRVGQYVMARVAINNPKFTLIGGDTMTSQVRVHGLKVRTDLLQISTDLVLTNSDIYGYAPLDGQSKIETATMVPDDLGNYLGADLEMSVNSEFYRDASGKILLDTNNIPIIKRDPTGATVVGNYLDAFGNEILDADGKPIPILTITKGDSIIPAPPLKTGSFRTPQKMIDWSVPGSFTQYDDGMLDWRLFEGQVVRFSFVPRVGQGTVDNPDFIFDTPASRVAEPEITLSTIKYIIPTQGINYRFDQSQLKDITFASDDDQPEPYTGASHISSPLTIVRILPDFTEQTLVGSDIEEQVKIDFEDRVQIKMQLTKQNGTASSAIGSNISQFTGLSNGDVLTISFESKDINYALPKPIPPLTIVVKGLFVKPLDVDLFKNLRPDFTGSLNGSGAFSIKVTNPNIPSETNETVLGPDQWYEYQVWNADKTLKTSWTRDETKINNLVNGDKVEWKLVNRDGVFLDDYYNTLLAKGDNSDEIKFRVVNVVDKIEETVQEGIGNSNKLNPDQPSGQPNYPEASGWVVSGLKIEISLDSIQQEKFEQALAQFQPTFSGVNQFGSMNSNILNDDSISKDVVIVWYTSSGDGMPRRITDFKDAGLSNGDKVWATIAPSQEAMENNLIIDESISQMSSKVFIVEGLTTIVNSTTQTLIVSLITASSVLLVGTIGVIVFMRKNGKLGGNKKFKL